MCLTIDRIELACATMRTVSPRATRGAMPFIQSGQTRLAQSAKLSVRGTEIPFSMVTICCLPGWDMTVIGLPQAT